MAMDYDTGSKTIGVIATIGLYSVLYKENKFYRFFEHVFLGLAAGYAIVALWTETLKADWWDLMVGRMAERGEPAVAGNWLWMILLPIGLMGYFVFSNKHNWISRIPIGIILGLWSGQQVQVWWTQYGPQINASLLPVIPTTFSPIFKPDTTPAAHLTPAQISAINSNLYLSQAASNLIAVFTILAVLSYFLFSFDFKNKGILFMSKSGRYLLMVGFGAIFGTTVMMRFSLLIDRMYFIWIEWLKHGIFGMH